MENYKRVYVTTDDDGHWYVIPFELRSLFSQLLEDGEKDEWTVFMELFGEYITGGDINLTELYIKDEK